MKPGRERGVGGRRSRRRVGEEREEGVLPERLVAREIRARDRAGFLPARGAEADAKPADGLHAGARERTDLQAGDDLLRVVLVAVGERVVGDAVVDAERVAEHAAEEVAVQLDAEIAIR